jgi:hypothetical protein
MNTLNPAARRAAAGGMPLCGYFAGRGLDFVLGRCASMKNRIAFTSACVRVGLNRICWWLTSSKSASRAGSQRKLNSVVGVSDFCLPTSYSVNILILSGNRRLPSYLVIQYHTLMRRQLEKRREFMPGIGQEAGK